MVKLGGNIKFGEGNNYKLLSICPHPNTHTYTFKNETKVGV